MKEESTYENMQEVKEKKVDIQEIFFKYLIHWPWIVGAVILCVIVAWIYLRMVTPVYNISATVLIKDDKKGGASSQLSELENLGLDGMFSSSQNFDNELEVLRSKTLAKEVIQQLNLYVSYMDEDEFPAQDMYKISPIQVSLTPQEADKLSDPMIVKMALQPQGGIDVVVTVGEIEYQKYFDKLPAIFPTNEGTLAFFQVPDSVLIMQERKIGTLDIAEKTIRHITATINRPMTVA